MPARDDGPEAESPDLGFDRPPPAGPAGPDVAVLPLRLPVRAPDAGGRTVVAG